MMAQSKPKHKGTNYVVNKAYIFIICPPIQCCTPFLSVNILSMTFLSYELFAIFIGKKILL